MLDKVIGIASFGCLMFYAGAFITAWNRSKEDKAKSDKIKQESSN